VSQEEPTDRPSSSRTYLDVLKDRGRELVGMYRAKDRGEAPLTHITTGIPRLDRMGMGEMGVLTTIALHSGDGKSMLRKQLEQAAAAAGHRVQSYVMEDPAELAADRTFADLMDEDSLALRRLRLDGGAEHVVSRVAAAITDATPWAKNIEFIDEPMGLSTLYESIMDRWYGPDGNPTRLVLYDYVQMIDPEADEKSQERTVAGFAKLGLRIAKGDRQYNRGRCSFTGFSQLRSEVVARGRRWFENAKWNAERQGKQLDDTALYGFRPGDGDLQWSSALTQRSKIILYGFRPGRWARKMGLAGIPDDIMELYSDKENFGPDANTVTLSWDGPRGRVWDPRK
jgi:hypothetical protein